VCGNFWIRCKSEKNPGADQLEYKLKWNLHYYEIRIVGKGERTGSALAGQSFASSWEKVCIN